MAVPMSRWDELYPNVGKVACAACGRPALVAASLGVCLDCLRCGDAATLEGVAAAHARARRPFDLPAVPPQAANGAPCPLCVNQCRIPLGESGYCGSKVNSGGHLTHRWGAGSGLLDWYYDPIPTNCVAAWVCGAREAYGCRNLAVFFRACSFDCLFCQNWHFKTRLRDAHPMLAADLAARADSLTACICYFGGDPAPQAPYSLLAARLALARRRARPLRICWETNGSENPAIMRTMARLALATGGTIKIDLKALDDNVHWALTGSSNAWTLNNIRLLAGMMRPPPAPPLLVVSTLLVPGYVEVDEVRAIARFLAGLNPAIPYSLLAFCPQFLMDDLPPTSRQHGVACHEAAREEGLQQVKLGNVQLLW